MANPTAGQRHERMFCIKGDKVILAEPGMTLSHREWFQREGWIARDGAAGADGDEEKFFRHVVSGRYLPDDDELYCYREIDFAEDFEVIDIIVHHLVPLEKALGMSPHTKVFIGPCGDEAHAADARRHYAGKLSELAKYVEKHERMVGGGMGM